MAARPPHLERDQAPPEVQAVYDGLQKATGRLTNRFNEALGTELES